MCDNGFVTEDRATEIGSMTPPIYCSQRNLPLRGEAISIVHGAASNTTSKLAQLSRPRTKRATVLK